LESRYCCSYFSRGKQSEADQAQPNSLGTRFSEIRIPNASIGVDDHLMIINLAVVDQQFMIRFDLLLPIVPMSDYSVVEGEEEQEKDELMMGEKNDDDTAHGTGFPNHHKPQPTTKPLHKASGWWGHQLLHLPSQAPAKRSRVVRSP
jgi:hypothetical protein